MTDLENSLIHDGKQLLVDEWCKLNPDKKYPDDFVAPLSVSEFLSTARQRPEVVDEQSLQRLEEIDRELREKFKSGLIKSA
jgi:hypothetical protein